MKENNENEVQKRVCRSCNEGYDYPVPRSTATRFYCSACAELPAGTRAIFEKYNKRIKALTAQVEKLEQRCRKLEPKSMTNDEARMSKE